MIKLYNWSRLLLCIDFLEMFKLNWTVFKVFMNTELQENDNQKNNLLQTEVLKRVFLNTDYVCVSLSLCIPPVAILYLNLTCDI